MLDWVKRLFNPEPSSVTARERLRLVLLSDHLALAPDVVESLKTDLIAVISKYVDVDTANCDVTFEQQDRAVAMLANIPILGMKPPPKKLASDLASCHAELVEASVDTAPAVPAFAQAAPVVQPHPQRTTDEALGSSPLPTVAVEQADGMHLATAQQDTFGATVPKPKARRRRRRRANANPAPVAG